MRAYLTANLYDFGDASQEIDLLTNTVVGHNPIGYHLITCSDLLDWLEENSIQVFFTKKLEYDLPGKNHSLSFGLTIKIPEDRIDLQMYFKLKWG